MAFFAAVVGAPHVLGVGHQFHVPHVDTGRISTQVVGHEVAGDVASQGEPCGTVRAGQATLAVDDDLELAVPLAVYGACPFSTAAVDP